MAAGGAWWQRRQSAPLPAQADSAQSAQVLFVDVAGWYEITPDETAVMARYDLRTGSLPDSLPLRLSEWRGSDLGPDADLEDLYDHPELVLRRQYADEREQPVWLTAIGSRGPKSFRVFEHTPHVCYPSSGWVSVADDVRRIPLSRGSLPVRRGVFDQESDTFVVYYWYQWDSPTRDAAEGVASWRLTTHAGDGIEGAEERLAVFLDLLFSGVVDWHRF